MGTTLITPEQIRTASLYPLKTLAERTTGTTRVLVTLYWPRGVKRELIHLWWPNFAPSRQLLMRYKVHEIDWCEFTNAYRDEMRDMAWPSWIDEVITRRNGITLLCHEHDAPEDTVCCHRRLLRDMLLGLEATDDHPDL